MSTPTVEHSRLHTGPTIVPGSQVVVSDEVAQIGGPHIRISSLGQGTADEPSRRSHQAGEGGSSHRIDQSHGFEMLQRSESQHSPANGPRPSSGRQASSEQGDGATHREPKVELIREGDIITAIDVTCSCGESIRLWCSYEGGS